MAKHANVNKIQQQQEPNGAQTKSPAKTNEKDAAANGKGDNTLRWKEKFLHIQELGDKADQKKEAEEKKMLEGFEEDTVGPDNFRVTAKLGQGSFGHVYVAEKLNIMPDGTAVPTGNLYAMKILNKKQIMGQNLVKYAKTERNVLTYTSHPFIVGMKFAF